MSAQVMTWTGLTAPVPASAAPPAGRLHPVQHPAQGPTVQPGALGQHRLGDLHRRLSAGRIKQREHHQAGLLVVDADHRPFHCRSHENSPS